MWAGLGVSLTASCTSPTPSAAPTTSTPPPEVPAATAGTILSSTAPEPTGVPGLAAADPFCAAWAGYAGTLQALGVAASFGGLVADRLAALELTSAPRLVEFAASIDAGWPAELAAEQATVIDNRIGPYMRRAQRGVEALRSAGVGSTELTALSAAWQASLAERDPRVAVIELPSVASDLQDKIDAAARAFDNDVTPFAEDPSLSVENVQTPATDEYLSTHCPDLASSGVGDAL